MKLSAISLFHTSIAHGEHTRLEQTLAGTHNSLYTSMGGGASSSGEASPLEIHRRFTEADIISYVDANVTKGSVKFDSASVTKLHGDGFISHATVTQVAMLVDASPQGAASRTSTTSSIEGQMHSNHTTNGLDARLLSKGSLSAFLQLVQQTNNTAILTPPGDDRMVTTTLLEAAKTSTGLLAATHDSDRVAHALEQGLETPSQTNAALSSLGRSLSPEETRQLLRSPLVASALTRSSASDEAVSHRVLFVLAAQRTATAESLLAWVLSTAASPSVRVSAALHLAALNSLSKETTATLRSVAAAAEENDDVRAVVMGALQAQPLRDEELPYNKSWEGSRVYGGNQINAGFGATAIVGTNWDCKHPTFNYEASAVAHANVTAFGYEKEAMRAEAQYGKIGGSPLDDVVSLVVWVSLRVAR